MTPPRDGPAITALHKEFVRLSQLQQELRSRLLLYQETHGLTLSQIATRSDIKYNALRDFLNGTLCMRGGQSLERLCAVIEAPELAEELTRISAPIPDRYCGLGLVNADAIRLALDIFTVWFAHRDELTRAAFTALFRSHQELIDGVLNASTEAVRQLEDSSIQDALLEILASDDFEQRLAGTVATMARERAEAHAALLTAVEQLQSRYGSRASIAQALGVSQTALNSACQGSTKSVTLNSLQAIARKAIDHLNTPVPAQNTSDLEGIAAKQRFNELYARLAERYGSRRQIALAVRTSETWLYDAQRRTVSKANLEVFFERAEALLSDSTAVPTPEPATEPAAVSTDRQAGAPDIVSRIGQYAGTTNDEGVRFVLTEASFQELSQVPIMALRDFLLQVLPLARMALNIGAQVSDDTARGILRNDVGKELKELELAVRTFTFAHPNQLLSLYDSQREAWKRPNQLLQKED